MSIGGIDAGTGEWSTGTVDSCTACTPGRYLSDATEVDAASACTDCVAGTWSEGTVDSCTDCAAGSYSAATAAACFICADGTYSTIEASVTSDDCVACPAGFESNPIGTAEGHNEEYDCEAVDGGHRDLDDDGGEEEGDDGAEEVDDEDDGEDDNHHDDGAANSSKLTKVVVAAGCASAVLFGLWM